jgi:hypothetical protein
MLDKVSAREQIAHIVEDHACLDLVALLVGSHLLERVSDALTSDLRRKLYIYPVPPNTRILICSAILTSSVMKLRIWQIFSL